MLRSGILLLRSLSVQIACFGLLLALGPPALAQIVPPDNLEEVIPGDHPREPALTAPSAITQPLRLPAPSSINGSPSASTSGTSWMPAGAAPITGGQVENVSPNNEVAGAIHIVLPHPTNADIMYIGAVNGGIWKTTNATNSSPTWTPLTDFVQSLSIAAMEFDPTDTSYNTIWAAIGKNSSYASFGGQLTGLLKTTDGGTTWTEIDGGGVLDNKDITSVIARGNTVLVSVDFATPFTFGNIGIFRSTDGGANFTQISVGDGTASGLPGGTSYDAESHAGDPATIYTTIRFAEIEGGVSGVYKSIDTGATWTLVGTATMNALMTGSTSNAEITIHHTTSSNVVYVAILVNGQLINGGVFRSDDGGTTWTQMDNPVTNEVGGSGSGVVGTNPRFKPSAGAPGSQGAIHFAIFADPTDADLLYIGGDRQPAGLNDTGGFPNSIGATDFTGRLFRGDASETPNGTGAAPSPQWKHLTHVVDAGGMMGGGTASSSAPHADARSMAFDANGNLIQTDDGGIYKRTSPQDNTGDWFSLNGNLQISEMHDIAYDTATNILFSGNQDTGTPEQANSGDTTWFSVSTGDGGDTSVGPNATAGETVRYSSFQNLGVFRARLFDASNNLLATVSPALNPTAGNPSLIPNFRTAFRANPHVAGRIVLVGKNGIYESSDYGSTISLIFGPVSSATVTSQQAAIANGTAGNPNALYVGFRAGMYGRSTSGALSLLTAYTGGTPYQIVMDDADWQRVWVVSSGGIWASEDAGASWSDITADFPGRAHSLAYASCSDSACGLYVGGDSGVYKYEPTSTPMWQDHDNGLPNAPVYELQYDAVDKLLIAATMGRGAWTYRLPKYCQGQVVTVDIGLGDMPTDNADVILGTPNDDVIFAKKGDDLVCAGDGLDTVFGGHGIDTIYGEDGNDRLRGGRDADIIYGGPGDDNIRGAMGNDMIYGDAGNDKIIGQADNDTIDGGDDTDDCRGGRGLDSAVNCESERSIP